MEVAKDTRKQEKQLRAIRIGGGGVAVWGGVAVVAALVVASYSAIKNSRKRRSNGKTTATADKLNKGNSEAETKIEARTIEIMGKLREDKADHDNKALAGEEKKGEDAIINSKTQKDRLSAGEEAKVRVIEGDETIKVMPRKPRVEADYKEQVNREQGHELGESVVKKDEELAEEIEVDTPMTLSGENGEDSDENSSIDEDGGDNAQKGSQIQHMGKEGKCVRNENVERKEGIVETAPQLNQFATRGKLEVTDEESIHEEEEQEYDDGKGMLEKEESSDTNEEDDDEDEESSEGTGDSSMKSNINAIWPAEAIDDVLMEIKHRKIDTQISEEKTDYIKAEMEEKGIKNDYNATNLCEVEYSGKTIFNSLKRYMKELPFYSSNATVWLWASNARVWLWAMLVLALALAAPLVLSAGEIMKLALVVFFVVGLSRAVDTII